MSEAISRARSGIDWRLLLLLGMLAACGPLSVDMYLPSLPAIAKAFVVDEGAAQLTLTTYMFGFAVGMLLYGPLSDAYGRRPILLIGVGLYVVATLACALAFGIDDLTTMRFFQALGAGAASVLARAVARDVHGPLDAARTLSMMAMITAIGPLLAPLVGGQLLLLGGWRMVFVLLTLIGIAAFAAVYYRVQESWPLEKRAQNALQTSFTAYGKLLRDPLVWGHTLCGGAAFAAMFAYITATPFVYIEYFGVSAQHYGFLFGINIVGIILGNFLNTRWVGRIGTLRIIGIAAGVSCVASFAVSLFCLTGLGGLAAIATGLFFVVGVNGVLGANCTTDLMHRYPINAGAGAALFGCSQFASGAIASIAVGLLSDGTPYAMGVVVGVSGVLCVIGRTMVLRLHDRPALA